MTLEAAHSMDTVWFSVDDEGHVAVLDSGEAGTLPEAWKGGEDAGYDFMQLLPRLGILVSADAAPGRETDAKEITLETVSSVDWGRVILVESAHPRLLDRFVGATAFDGESATYLLIQSDEASEGQLTEAWRRGLVRRAWAPFWRTETPPSALFGVYEYTHDTYGVSQPYERVGVPSRPLHIDDLPTSIQEFAIRLPVRFADAPRLQPASHLPCANWQNAWADVDGNVYPS
ncbi:MAG: hypothetical protein AAGA48_02830 [Myxococcota bacterium]